MSSSRRSPTLRRRRLSAELRRLRQDCGLTALDVTQRLSWAAGKLTRMERGEWVRPNPRDVQDLLDVYEVTDEHQREQLMAWAREGRERGWWHPYRDMLSESYTTFVGLEAEASTERTFELAVIPGLLQTADYARALLRSGPAEISSEQIEQRVDIRLARQSILTSGDPLRLLAVVDEAALRRPAGDETVMRAQLEHLLEAAELPRVTLLVIPFRKGRHPGTTGPFTILEFPERLDPDAVYVENVAGELFIEEPSDVDRFRIAFERLTAVAESPEDTIKMIAGLLRT
ncbi:helix-turn-helix domain-containing protein [Actinomadura hibisca]|uniref:helix-turn-helix domain-containing protein n=1 Tax=Actinomadura hibisca TaxID=68565 RepID=UPI0008308C00|nr:helix-turn-helix transcriptional regulator [Actinomadura hibisca]